MRLSYRLLIAIPLALVLLAGGAALYVPSIVIGLFAGGMLGGCGPILADWLAVWLWVLAASALAAPVVLVASGKWRRMILAFVISVVVDVGYYALGLAVSIVFC